MRTRSWTTLAATLLMALSLPVAATETRSTRWLHVSVVETSDGANVELNLPMNLVLAIIDGLEVDGFSRGKVELDLDDADLDWPQVLAALKTCPDGDFVKVDAPDGRVEIAKKGGIVTIHAVEVGGDNAVADITMPEAMLAAFSVDEANQVDVAALLRSVTDLPVGDLIRVTSSDANVRIWVE